MKAFICFLPVGIVLLLGSITVGVGQNPPQPLYSSPVVTDPSCFYDATNCGMSFANCDSGDVYVFDAASYSLHVWITCVPGDTVNCGGCYACAHLIRTLDGHDMFGPVHTACGHCDVTSPPDSLLPGVKYKLYVCKKPCNSTTCATCNVDCAAHGQIHG
jgi:hypothetical protein